jgi:hypothetical protein
MLPWLPLASAMRSPNVNCSSAEETRLARAYRAQQKMIGGRRTKVPGTDNLLVPGIPEADNQPAALNALHGWMNQSKNVRIAGREINELIGRSERI